MRSHYALTGTIGYYRTPPARVELRRFDPRQWNRLVTQEDTISVGHGQPIEGPFDFGRWKDPPHVALANLLDDPAAALRFTRTYGVFSPDYSADGRPMSISLEDVFRGRDQLRRAWEDGNEFLKILNRQDTKALLWVRQAGMEIVIEDLPTLIWVLFSRDRWDGKTRKCARPDCPAPYFLAVRRGQKFCSQRCAVLINVRRFREREARNRALRDKRKLKRGKHAKAKKA